MHILFLAYRDRSNPYCGGGDVYVDELAKGLARRGHIVTIVSSRFSGSKPEEFVDNVRVIRRGSGFTMFLLVFAYYFMHLRGKFDIVVEEVLGGLRIPFFASFYMKEKVVGIIHQKHEELFRHQFSFPIAFTLSLLERFLVLLYRNQQIIVNSLRTQEDLIGIGYPKENMHVINPGLPEYFLNLHNRAFSCRSLKVICLSKLRRYKQIDEAVWAMKKVLEVVPHCELTIVGRTNDFDPEYENELRRLVCHLGLSSIVRFEKDVTENQKIKLLQQSRALVLPSAIEGFGIVVIEANACGTPAIVSDRIPADAAVHNYNAIVFPYHNVSALSKAIISLMLDESKWSRMSLNSVIWAKRFTWEVSAERIAQVIESA